MHPISSIACLLVAVWASAWAKGGFGCSWPLRVHASCWHRGCGHRAADEVAPAAKAFGVFVGLMGLHEALEAGAGQVFQKLLETVYPEHVAAQGLELTLGLVVH